MVNVVASQSVARSVRRKVHRTTDRFWHVEDFAQDPKAVELELGRLVTDGELERVRRGVYWRGSRTQFGMTVAPPLDAVRKIVGEGEAIGAAEWYATNLLGFSTQVSPVPVIAVSRRTPTGVPDVRLVSRASRTGRRTAHLNNREVTVLEALDGWDKYVELDAEAAIERFLHILGDPDVRVERLVAASRTESSRARERLRFLLERAGRWTDAAKVGQARSRAGREKALAVMGRFA